MDYYIFYGELSDEGKSAWNGNEVSPFNMLVVNNHIECRGGWTDFLSWTRRNLHDEVRVDWGSMAWKCTGEDLRDLKEHTTKCEIESYDEIEPEKEYGIVFIEMS